MAKSVLKSEATVKLLILGGFLNALFGFTLAAIFGEVSAGLILAVIFFFFGVGLTLAILLLAERMLKD